MITTTQIHDDIAFVRSIIPANFTVTESKQKGSIRCVGAPNDGFRKPNSDADDQEGFDLFHAKLKEHFAGRFQETYCNTCTWYQDFIIYLKP